MIRPSFSGQQPERMLSDPKPVLYREVRRRPALYGVLAEIDALGLDLIEVRQLTADRKSPGSGDSRSP
jgi:hypothetical protein